MSERNREAHSVPASLPQQYVTSTVALTKLGFGAAPIGNLYTAVGDRDAIAAVHHAWAQGIRYFDTAPYYGYGLSEQRLGAALSDVPRDSYTLSTKVGRTVSRDTGPTEGTDGFATSGRAMFDYSRDGIRRAVDASLQRLRVQYIDILLLHDIGELTHGARHAEVMRQVFDESLPTLAELKRDGVCGAVGLGVNEQAVCLEVLAETSLDCIMLAGRYTLLEQANSALLLEEATRRAVSIIVAGPYNSGLLSAAEGPGLTYNYAPANPEVLDTALQLYHASWDANIDIGAAALQFPLAHPAVVSVVAGMRSRDEVVSAIRRFNTEIPGTFWQTLKEQGLLQPGAPTP